jgi:hypothetical protein
VPYRAARITARAAGHPENAERRLAQGPPVAGSSAKDAGAGIVEDLASKRHRGVRRAFDIEFCAAGIDPTMRSAIFSRSAAVQASNSACRFTGGALDLEIRPQPRISSIGGS